MTEENADLVQQLEANLASFKAAGLDEEAASVQKKLDAVKGSATAKPANGRKTRKTTRKGVK